MVHVSRSIEIGVPPCLNRIPLLSASLEQARWVSSPVFTSVWREPPSRSWSGRIAKNSCRVRGAATPTTTTASRPSPVTTVPARRRFPDAIVCGDDRTCSAFLKVFMPNLARPDVDVLHEEATRSRARASTSPTRASTSDRGPSGHAEQLSSGTGLLWRNRSRCWGVLPCGSETATRSVA